MTDKKSKEVQYCVFFTTFTFGLEFFCFITVMHAAYFVEFLNQKPSTFQTTGGERGAVCAAVTSFYQLNISHLTGNGFDFVCFLFVTLTNIS